MRTICAVAVTLQLRYKLMSEILGNFVHVDDTEGALSSISRFLPTAFLRRRCEVARNHAITTIHMFLLPLERNMQCSKVTCSAKAPV